MTCFELRRGGRRDSIECLEFFFTQSLWDSTTPPQIRIIFSRVLSIELLAEIHIRHRNCLLMNNNHNNSKVQFVLKCNSRRDERRDFLWNYDMKTHDRRLIIANKRRIKKMKRNAKMTIMIVLNYWWWWERERARAFIKCLQVWFEKEKPPNYQAVLPKFW